MYFNVLEEIQPYIHKFEKMKIENGKLMSCSPFRTDNTPSFVLWLDKGNWKDSAGIEQYGGFVKLLSYLAGESEESIKEYLQEKTGGNIDIEKVKLVINLKMKKTEEETETWYDLPQEYRFRSDYLERRGITEEVQQMFKIGFIKGQNAVVIPWSNGAGKIVRFQYRSTKDKKFWYSKTGGSVKDQLFGISEVIKQDIKKVYITESAIDAMYLWSLGVPSVALGTASISSGQIALILNSSIENLVIATDNDTAGQQVKEKIIKELAGKIRVYDFEFPEGIKDMNNMTREQIEKLEERNVIKFNFKI